MISTATVQLLHEYTGRGPTKAKTLISDDVVAVLLADTLTRGERKLVESGSKQQPYIGNPFQGLSRTGLDLLKHPLA